MADLDLPPAFQTLPLAPAERTAIARFIAEAPHVAPGVALVAPRRTPAGRLAIVLAFPQGDTWALTEGLVRLAQRIEDETGIYMHLD